MQKKLVAQGAEAKLFMEDGEILKRRFPKSYRLREIDESLRGFRTRREAKMLQKLGAINFPSPRLIKSDDKENLVIEKINGKLLKEVLNEGKNFSVKEKNFCSEIGKKIAILHNNSIIHGDLTTSNMILNKEVCFIDFGLSFFSGKAEDKAVDLHLLREALESKHYKIWEDCLKCAISAYKKEAKNSNETLKRLEIVEKRGRYMRASLRARPQTTTVRKREIKAVLFDLDGVLVDSIDAWHRTYNDILRHFQASPVPKSEFRNIFGNTIEANVKMMVNISAKEANRLAIRYFKKNVSRIRIFPQTKNVLERLSSSKVKTALITNTPKAILSSVLRHYNLRRYFKAVVAIDDVKKGKPAPDMALKACRLLKVKPKEAVLVGDTKNDMLAGKRAGCITVGCGIKGNFTINSLNSITSFLNQNPNRSKNEPSIAKRDTRLFA